eukprot:ANDGO_02490.mRNA.1 Coatomer subunit beta-2
MVVAQERLCTYLIDYAKVSSVSVADLKTRLMNSDEDTKIEAMKQLLHTLATGERLPQLLMPVIQYIVPSQNHVLKKLALLYWEVVDKKDQNGRLLAEMILVINFLRMDLNSPNEYVRGATLRLLSKIRSPEILEDLTSSVLQCLEHRHSYVRRNAVLAMHAIHKNYPFLMPDAPEHIEKFLQQESDLSARRNAFYMLFDCAPDKAAEYIKGLSDSVLTEGEIMQIVLVDAMRKFCKADHEDKPLFFRMLFKLLMSDAAAVMYQCATTVISLSGSPTAVRAVASTYARLLAKESDTNVRLIVLERVKELKDRYPSVLEEQIMEILSVVETQNAEVRKKALEIALDLVSKKNVEEVVIFLRKQIIKALAPESERSPEYCKMLIDAVHTCVVRFPETAESVINVLMDFLTEPAANLAGSSSGAGGSLSVSGSASTSMTSPPTNGLSGSSASSGTTPSTAVEVVLFVREIMELFPNQRESLLARLRETFPDISASRVFRTALWIIGDYSTSVMEVMSGYETIMRALGPIPFGSGSEQSSFLERPKDEDAGSAASSSFSTRGGTNSTARINADGTYASQSSATLHPTKVSAQRLSSINVETDLQLRRLIRQGDFYLATVLASTLTKLVYRVWAVHPDQRTRLQVQNEVLLVLTSLLRMGKSQAVSLQSSSSSDLSSVGSTLQVAQSKKPTTLMDQDSFDRIALCLNLTADVKPENATIILQKSRDVFASLVHLHSAEREKLRESSLLRDAFHAAVPVDQTISFRLLRPQRGGETIDYDEEADLSKAVGNEERLGGIRGNQGSFAARLERVYQLTGFSDPVYAEAYVTIHQYDIILDITVANQTPDTLDNVSIDLSTIGDLRICEKPPILSLAPYEKRDVRSSIKVSSTDNGAILGSILFDQVGSSSERRSVVLSDIHVDIMEYIRPSKCSDVQFRSMWAEFEWENKVPINTEFPDLKCFLDHMCGITNMAILTEGAASDKDCPFLSANLYARSTFGEDALANVSVERSVDGKVSGFVRIRSKTQGVALALGDRITAMQRVTSAAAIKESLTSAPVATTVVSE